MSKRGEKEDVLAEEDVNQTGGCEALLEGMTFEVSVKDDWMHNVIRVKPSTGRRRAQIMNASLTFV